MVICAANLSLSRFYLGDFVYAVVQMRSTDPLRDRDDDLLRASAVGFALRLIQIWRSAGARRSQAAQFAVYFIRHAGI